MIYKVYRYTHVYLDKTPHHATSSALRLSKVECSSWAFQNFKPVLSILARGGILSKAVNLDLP